LIKTDKTECFTTALETAASQAKETLTESFAMELQAEQQGRAISVTATLHFLTAFQLSEREIITGSKQLK